VAEFPWLSRRQLNGLGALACAGMMGFALYAQYGLELDPCPLCVFQRVAVITLGAVFLLAFLHGPGGAGARLYGGLMCVPAIGGMAVAGRQVWLQHLPKDEVPACGPGLDYILDVFPFHEALAMVFEGSGECAEVEWSFLGLSMAGWVFVILAGLVLFAIWNNFRRESRAF
jgi:disulfide bond formation protein DsbB